VEQATRSFIQGRIGFEAVNHEELLRRMRNGQVTVLDVRPAEEFRAGHLPRALSVPLEDLEARVKDLPAGPFWTRKDLPMGVEIMWISKV